MGAILGRATESWLDAGCPMDDAAIDGILDAALAEA
jgi:hypothetical protein